jgi:SAM-dependent methyltransferase
MPTEPAKIVSYRTFDAFEGWSADLFKSTIAEHHLLRVLEIGSGANPTLTPGFVRDHNLVYVTSDISPEELEKADPAYQRLVLDLSVPEIDPALVGGFDCIASRMVAEHIRDGRAYHRNIFKLLRPGGISVHCFSTLFSLPFLANRLLPEMLTETLLDFFNPRDRHSRDKFRAYYSWSRGPSPASLRRFDSLGFEVLRYTGYFGHPYYKRLPVLDRVDQWKSRQLQQHPIPQLCSYATIVLRKPH